MAEKNQNYSTEKVSALLEKVKLKIAEYDKFIAAQDQYYNPEAFDKLPLEERLELIEQAELQAGILGDSSTKSITKNKRAMEKLGAPTRSKIASLNKILF